LGGAISNAERAIEIQKDTEEARKKIINNKNSDSFTLEDDKPKEL